MNKVNALVLAGDSNKGEFGPDIINKSFIEIDGKWLVEYVVDALRESHRIHSISIVGPVERLKNRLDGKVDYFIQEEKHILENLQIGLEPFKEDDFVIVVTSDIPMINGDVISDFIERCSIYEADLCYPIVDKKVNNRLYPGFSRTYVKLKDGTFTGGNIVGINPEKMKSYWEFASRIIEKRKKPLELGRLLGPRFLLLLATGQLSIAHIEERFFELLKIKARAIISPYPEIANDIDQPGHIEIVNQYLKK
ncbi:MAG: NTP transferase domain-containing protein [Clostridiales bacterium]|nr:NTP transferase domain-containing protein [Clostridiales bacterium]